MNADDNNSCHSRTVVYVSSTRSKLYLEGDTDLPLTDTSKGIQSEALLTSTRNEIQTEQHERGGTWWACLLGTHHRVWESINMHKMRFVFTILFPAACEERNQAWVLLAGQGISQGYCQGYCHITHTHTPTPWQDIYRSSSHAAKCITRPILPQGCHWGKHYYRFYFMVMSENLMTSSLYNTLEILINMTTL